MSPPSSLFHHSRGLDVVFGPRVSCCVKPQGRLQNYQRWDSQDRIAPRRVRQPRVVAVQRERRRPLSLTHSTALHTRFTGHAQVDRMNWRAPVLFLDFTGWTALLTIYTSV
ncbi:hypothetical protein VZT92_014067 [Zoarces viviparus]|uniref:Uncharacterized protein n=1 Tax=Zoarces viviparus TaxID=48416 RepID=A0AAW1EY22_ZOAVI